MTHTTTLSRAARALAAALLIAAPAVVVTAPPPAYADCGDPGEPACTGPVPTDDEVVAILDKLTDPDIPAANKADVVTPGFSPEEAGMVDDHLNRLHGDGGVWCIPTGALRSHRHPTRAQ